MQRYTIFFIAATASLGELAVQAWRIPDAVCTVWAPDDGRKKRLKHVQQWQQ
jgi:hypothetical protein